jgi:hypothetical protein
MSGRTEAWAAYEIWNLAIAAEFFDVSHKDRPVYIDLEDDALQRIARDVGARATSHLPENSRESLAPLSTLSTANEARSPRTSIGSSVGVPPT